MSNPAQSSPSLRRRALASVAAVAIVASGAVGATLIETKSPAYAQPVTQGLPSAQAPATFADVVERVKPAVVSVRVKMENVLSRDEGALGHDELPPQLRDLFRRFGENGGRFNEGVPAPQLRRPQQAQGSGFFISADGYVVTNNHVVDHATSVTVTTDDGRTLDAKVIGTDPKTDLALLKVTESGPFPYVQLAKTAPRVGDWVVAVGNPFGLGGTVTSGIVSARGRDIGAGPYDDFLQIDAPINKGNSGGPTFNLSGEVVGVNTAIYSPSGGSVGLAFAIPADTVSSVVGQLEKDGQVSRGYVGVRIQSLTKDLADGLGLSSTKGALVDSAEPGTPGAKAGLKSGDVITAINGDPVASAREVTRKVGSMKPGSKVELTYLRDGKTMTASVELGSLPGEKNVKVERDTMGQGLRLGLELAPASQAAGAGDQGVAVIGVDPSGPAAAKGIRTGDVILEVAGKPVSRPADVQAGLEAAQKDGKRAVLMRIKSGQDTRFVAIAMPNAG